MSTIIKQQCHESKKLRDSVRGQPCFTQSDVRSLFDYNPENGVVTWKKLAVKNQMKVGDVAGYITDRGYMRVEIGKVSYYLHRIVWLYVYGVFPDGDIDHINHNRADNSISNLRDVCRIENGQNRSKGRNNTSGVVGVGWHKMKGKWQARITIGKELLHLGSFNEISDAIAARKMAEKQYGFHTNHGA